MSNTPEIRFNGYTDDWEQRKLSECAGFRRGSFPQPYGNKDWYDGEGAMPFVQVADVANDMKLVEDTKQKISKLAQPMSVFAEKGSVLVTLQGSIGRVAITQYEAFVDRTVLIFDKYAENIDKRFWAYIIKEKFEDEARKAPGGTIKTITKEALSDFDLLLPSYEEQNKLADCLMNLDHLITLHQRKCDEIKELKKYMLQNMFPQKGEKVPRIRFNGYTDDWEQRKVGEVIEDYTEKTVVQNQYPVLTSSQQQGIVLQEDYFADRQVTTNDNIGYYVLPKGYFTYRSRSDTDLFVFNRNNLIDKGIISYYYPVFRPKNADSNFLLRRLNHGMKAQLAMAAEGTGQHVLAHGKFKNMEFLVPSIQEQEQIGAYFEKLDNLITLHQRNCDELKELKKYMLQKMFPKEK